MAAIRSIDPHPTKPHLWLLTFAPCGHSRLAEKHGTAPTWPEAVCLGESCVAERVARNERILHPPAARKDVTDGR